jgi:hypothetical protein
VAEARTSPGGLKKDSQMTADQILEDTARVDVENQDIIDRARLREASDTQKSAVSVTDHLAWKGKNVALPIVNVVDEKSVAASEMAAADATVSAKEPTDPDATQVVIHENCETPADVSADPETTDEPQDATSVEAEAEEPQTMAGSAVATLRIKARAMETRSDDASSVAV